MNMKRIQDTIKTVTNWSKKWFAGFIYDQYGVSIVKRNPPSYAIVFPGEISQPNIVPAHITPPLYALGSAEDVPDDIIFKTAAEIPLIRQSCSLARKILNAAGNHLKVGMTTDELDKYVHQLIISNLAYPSPLRYNGFPKSICTSVNNVACHGVPDDRPLENGDIISIDVTVYYEGFHGDCCATFLVGDVNESGRRLVAATEEVLNIAISKCKPGEPLSLIAETICREAAKHKFTVLPAIHGHGIGRYFHEAPPVLHEIDRSHDLDEEDVEMAPGMTFTIEPVLSEGSSEVILLKDDWTLVTEDDSRTAQFEHTILITKDGAEILTK